MPVIIVGAVMMIPVIIAMFNTSRKRKYDYQSNHNGTEYILFHFIRFMTAVFKKSCQSFFRCNL